MNTFSPKKSLKYRSFELAYRVFAKPLMKFIVKKVGGDSDAAEEVFSRTTFAALNGWYKFESKSSYFTWVCKIALHKLADYYRERIHERSRIVVPGLEALAQFPAVALSAEEKLVLDQLKIAVHDCLKLLPEDKRRVLYLRYFKDLTIRKIGETLGISDRAVEGQIYRAKKDLKLLLVNNCPAISDNFLPRSPNNN